MGIEDLKEVIKIIPDILQYYAPGFIFLSIRDVNLSYNTKDNNLFFINSIVISYIFVKLTDIPLSWLPWDIKSNFVITLIFTLIFSGVYVNFNLENIWLSIFCKGKTLNNDPFWHLLNSEGSWVRVYEKNRIYIGQIHYSPNISNGDNKYLVLKAFTTYNSDWDILESHANDKKQKVMLNLNNIEAIEKVNGI